MAKIFIVEDEESLRRLYQIVLEAVGHEIIASAIDGNEAISMFENFENKPDLIIMDHRMPNKNGLDATKEILKLNNTVNIIFASADIEACKIALSLGAKGYLEKPFKIDLLQKSIENILNQE